MTEQDTLIIHKDLQPVETAQILALDFAKAGRSASKKEAWVVMALAAALTKLEIYPLEAFGHSGTLGICK